MQSTIISSVGFDGLNPGLLWEALDAETKVEAARGLYSREHGDPAARSEADEALARALRFRLVKIRQLPVEKRIAHLARVPQLDDSLIEALLIALHVARRRPMLVTFLDHLEIPHNDGVIDESYEPVPQDPERLEKAVGRLLEEFPAREVEIYLATLVAMDPDTWGGLSPLFEE